MDQWTNRQTQPLKRRADPSRNVAFSLICVVFRNASSDIIGEQTRREALLGTKEKVERRIRKEEDKEGHNFSQVEE